MSNQVYGIPFPRWYYNTDHWDNVRDQTLREAEYMCEIVDGTERCSREATQCHHVTYVGNYFAEVAGIDVIAVCGYHHMQLHGIVKPKPPDNDNQVMFDWFDKDVA